MLPALATSYALHQLLAYWMRLELPIVSVLHFMVSLLCCKSSLTARAAAFSPSRFSSLRRRPFHSTPTFHSSMQYWNREESTPQNYASDAPIIKHAKIISLSALDDDANAAVNSGNLPQGASLLAVGSCMDDFDIHQLQQEEPNVIFVAHAQARQPLADLLTALPSIEWIHARSAGIDFMTSPTLSSTCAVVTNAKGTFSSTLAEYTLLACSLFCQEYSSIDATKGRKKVEQV